MTPENINYLILGISAVMVVFLILAGLALTTYLAGRKGVMEAEANLLRARVEYARYWSSFGIDWRELIGMLSGVKGGAK